MNIVMPGTLPEPFSFRSMMAELTGRTSVDSMVNFDAPELSKLKKPMKDNTLGVFVSAGVYHAPSQRPFEITNDLTYRLVGREMLLSDLTIGHQAAIRKFAVEDLNVAYPRDRLLELEAEGVFKRLAGEAVSMVGAISSRTELLRQTVPDIYEEFARQQVDIVLLLPFCPACHAAVPLIARSLEIRGLPTIMTSCLWEAAQAYKAPRTAFLDFPMGCPAGKPNDAALQRAVLRQTLQSAPSFIPPWRVQELPFQWSADGSRSWESEVRDLYERDAKGFAQRVDSLSKGREALAGNEKEFAIRCAC